MFEHFNHHPELKWMAKAAGGFFKAGENLPLNPDIESFKLVRYADLRKHSVPKDDNSFKLMLVGNNRTDILVHGPDRLIDILITRLPSYIGKPWSELVDIELGNILLSCENFLADNKCNPWVIDNFEFKEIRPGQETPCCMGDLVEADKICAKCANFMNKKGYV